MYISRSLVEKYLMILPEKEVTGLRWGNMNSMHDEMSMGACKSLLDL